MNKQTYIFNINYLGEIYGIKALSMENIYFCKIIRANTCLKYRPMIREAIEREIEYNTFLREDLFDGWVVMIRIQKKGGEAICQNQQNVSHVSA